MGGAPSLALACYKHTGSDVIGCISKRTGKYIHLCATVVGLAVATLTSASGECPIIIIIIINVSAWIIYPG